MTRTALLVVTHLLGVGHLTRAAALARGDWQPQELIVLTPFRAQRALIRQRLRAWGVPESLRVSTVHRAQGSEAAVVLFDPADGSQPFLQTEEAQRLLNVALSRAQAKVLVFLSAADAANPLLAPIVQRLRLAGDSREAVPLLALARESGFPANALGRRVTAGRHTGEVLRLSPDGRQFWLVNERTGGELLIDAEFWRSRALEQAQAAEPSQAGDGRKRVACTSSAPHEPGPNHQSLV